MVNTEKYIGLGKRASQNQAELDNLVYRLVSVDGERFLGYPDDVRDDRICIEIDKDRVSKATIQ